MIKTTTKQLKTIFLAILMILGAIGLTPSTTHAAAATTSSPVGVVGYSLLIQQHPDAAKAQETMNAAVAQAKTDFEAKSATMNDNDKQAYYQQLQQGLQIKQQDLLKAISDKIEAAIKAVADAKGLTIVVDKSVTVYGGQDITDEVLKKITGK